MTLEIHASKIAGCENLPIAEFADLLADAYSQGEGLELEIAQAAYSLIMWTGSDCPWFKPGPSAVGLEVVDFRIVEEV